MAQEKTHKYTKEMNILKRTISQIKDGDIAPTVPKMDSKGKVFVKLYTDDIAGSEYTIEIKER